MSVTPNSPTTIRVYRAISPKSLASLREPLARKVFRVSKYDEEHGRRSFVVNADGSWVYDNTLRRGELGQGKMVLKEEQDAREEAQKHIQYLQEIISKFPRLHAAFADAPLLPQGLRFDRAERLIVLKNDTTEAASNPLWHWRVNYLLKFKPSGTEDYVPVEGGRCHIDLAPSGMILGAASGILPFQPNPSPSKRFTILDLRKGEAEKDSLSQPIENQVFAKGVSVVPLDVPIASSALREVDVFYAYNEASGCYAAYCAAIGGEGDRVAVCEEGIEHKQMKQPIFIQAEKFGKHFEEEQPPYGIRIPWNDDRRNYRRAIVGDANTGQLRGIIIIQADLDVPDVDILGYARQWRQNVVDVWESMTGGTVPIRVSSSQVGMITATDFNSMYPIGPLQGNPPPSEVVIYVNSRIDPVTSGDIMASNEIGRDVVLITVGNGQSANGVQVSHIINGHPFRGYMYWGNGAIEASHEFGHLCGLADRYAECSMFTLPASIANPILCNAYMGWDEDARIPGYPETNFDRTLPVNSFYANYTVAPRRRTKPIVFDEVGYDYLSNLMSNDLPIAIPLKLPSLSGTQLSIVFANQDGSRPFRLAWERTPFRLDLFFVNEEDSLFDGVFFLHTVIGNNTDGNSTVIFDALGLYYSCQLVPYSRSIGLYGRSQWFKLAAIGDFALVDNPSYLLGSSIQLPLFTQQNNGGTNTLYYDKKNLSNDLRYIGIPPRDSRRLMCHAVKWFIRNNLITSI